MIYRYLDCIKRDVSVIGFGTWAFGGETLLGGRATGWGPSDDGESIRAIDQAIEMGVNFFDTADMYGRGRSETVLGNALKNRKDAIICTKFGSRETEASEGFQDFSPEWVRSAVEGSLRRLRRETIDILLMHSPPAQFSFSSYDYSVFDDLKKQGKIKAWGISCKSVSHAEEALQSGAGEVYEILYNALDRRAEKLFPELLKRNVSVIARVPLASGFMTGKFLKDQPHFLKTDIRSSLPDEAVKWLNHSVRQLHFLSEEPGGLAVSALRFCFSHPAISTVIPGMRSVEQVKQLCEAGDRPVLSDEVLQKIAAAVPEVFSQWK